jgi:hypothetical protein
LADYQGSIRTPFQKAKTLSAIFCAAGFGSGKYQAASAFAFPSTIYNECVIVSLALPGARRVGAARLEELPAQRLRRKIMVAFHDLRAIGFSDDFSIPNAG